MADKKKDLTFWSTSSNGKVSSGGSAYSDRNRRKKASGQGCVVTLLVGASLLAGLSYFIHAAAGWLV
jgi:hypothetical protein